MRLFVLGGTGFIGSAVVAEAKAAGHEVVALARSSSSAEALTKMGATIISGDVRTPGSWVAQIGNVDAIVHMAATFSDDMASVEEGLIDHLLEQAAKQASRPRFLYTGGCWLYGSSGSLEITEDSPFNPMPEFAWMVTQRERLLEADAFDVVTLHPAMVYDRDGGVLARFIREANSGGPVHVVGSPDVRWPLVHRQDLACLYRLVLERGQTGADYHGVSESAVTVGRIAQAIAVRYGVPKELLVRPVDEVIAELGGWARGLAYDQIMASTLARRTLDWQPIHESVLDELAS